MVQKSKKFKGNPKKSTSAKTRPPPDVSWKQVKISGPVISDDGADLAGLIGLEILESYDRSLVIRDKRKNKKEPVSDDECDTSDSRLIAKKKSKRKRNDSGSSSNSDSEELSKNKKREKSLQLRKSLAPDAGSEEDSGIDDKSTNKKSKFEGKKTVQTKESFPGKFVLLKKVNDAANEKANMKRKNKNTNQEKRISEKKCGNAYSTNEYCQWSELGVSEPIIRALADKGFRNPTEIQTLSLPAAIMGQRDLLGAAETGSGKTLAFGIPLLEGIIKFRASEEYHASSKSLIGNKEAESDGHELTPPPDELEFYPELSTGEPIDQMDNDIKKEQLYKPLYALILTPTRELAVQINNHLKAVTKYLDIQIATVFGGLAAVKQERMLKKCPEIVIATPGRLWELIQSGNPHLGKVGEIRFLVIDETDRMLEKGHFIELKQLLEMMNKNEEATKRRRNYVFSATLTIDHDLPQHLIAKSRKNKNLQITKETPGQRLNKLVQIIGMTNPKVVDITQRHGTSHSLVESRILCKAEHKDYHLFYFLQRHPGRTLVFCNSIDCVKRLVSLFGYLNCDPLSLFGSMQQRQRLKNLERFTQNPTALLIATDVAARGLDIPNVDHVIHYQVPKTTENYIHRSGRTARASKEGVTILFIGADEVKDYVKLNQNLGRTEDLPMYPTSERLMKQIKDRVNLARDVERTDLRQRRNNESENWEEKVAKEFMSDSDIDSEQEEERKLAKSKEKRLMKARRYELSKLLATPIVMDRVQLKFPTSSGPNNFPSQKEKSAINLVQQVVEENIQFKKQRNKKRKRNE
ncbi:ATP-dependent RNA helicase DDX24 isoform X2 [Malaya genurostris]|uniref:ATP-dependent RNA helicase DDX24 isoform X2 n=1 Tax=Malaya genurostris TaxID=325434 RepID=UPI0026F3CD46|nr:ATP-dependent RNA helicase DDX24 isoform X2 [Malaya genurostris]